MILWLLEFTRYPGYDSYEEIVGVFSSKELAKEHCPFKGEWSIVSPQFESEKMVDPNDDIWFVFSIELDAEIQATYPTWIEHS